MVSTFERQGGRGLTGSKPRTNRRRTSSTWWCASCARLPLELALAILEGEAGYRTTGNGDGTATWYWPRPGGQWWSVPRSLDLAAHAALTDAIRESCRRNNGVSRRADVIELLRARLIPA
jgi:hypothetical protein